MSLDESSISYELRLQFETSVTQAIQNSLTLSRPLCIYLVNEEEEEEEEVTNEEDIANWELSHLPNKLQGSSENKCDLSMDSQNFLISKTINLKLVKNSNDFNLFLQAFPQFPMQFPCLYFIYGGVVLDCLLPHVEIEEFESRVQDVIKKVNTIEQQQQQQQQSNVSNTSTPQQTLPNTPTPQQVSQESTPIPTQRSSNDSSRQTISETPKPKPKPYKSLKEESAEYAAQKYRENLAKQNQKAKEEKQRILRLLKADEAERRSRAKLEREENRKEMNNVEEEGGKGGGKGEGEGEGDQEEGINKKSKITKIEEIHENLHNSKIDNSIEYLIQIKLFDGTSLKCKILHEKTLKDVREYINSIHKEYSNFNYSFYKPVDRMTYTLEMEDLKLIELHLNRATLILKPIDLDTNNQLLKNGSISNISYDKETGGFGWFKNKIGGLFGWGYNNNNNHINNNNHTDNNNNNGTIKLDENDDQINNEDHNKSNEEDIESKDENNRSKSPRIIDSSEYEYEYYTPRGGPSSLISRNSSPINPISSNNNNNNSNGMGMNFSSNNLNIPLSSEEINNGDSNPILSHVSSFTDLHHPRPHLVGNSSSNSNSNSNRVLKTPPGLGSSSTTRIRTMVDDWSGEEVINTNNNEIEFKTKKKDERKVYNGNFTNLEDDNKKKDEFSKQNEDKE